MTREVARAVISIGAFVVVGLVVVFDVELTGAMVGLVTGATDGLILKAEV